MASAGSICTAAPGLDDGGAFFSALAIGGTKGDSVAGVSFAGGSAAGVVAGVAGEFVPAVACGGALVLEADLAGDLGGVLGLQPKAKVNDNAKYIAKFRCTACPFENKAWES